MRQVSRREMIAASTGIAGFTFLPARVLGRGGAIPPSEKVNIAFVGIGNRASFNLRELANLGHNIVAICDVDWRKLDRRGPLAWQMAEKFNQAKKYDDWRIMLQEQNKNIDAVVVGTPDHDHTPVSVAAMKMGKHVYTEKPIAHSVSEAHAMAAAEKKYQVTGQTGCQGHASDDCRNVVEWIKDGAVGDVREVHIMSRQGEKQNRYNYAELPKRLAEDNPVPEGLGWDLWVGPAAFRPYNPLYVPGSAQQRGGWRDWREYGDGAVGDMCNHFFDPVVWALDLGLPEKVEARTDSGYDWETNKNTYPNSAEVRWEFPARGKQPPVAVTWHYGPDGGPVPRPKYWKDDYMPKYLETGKPTGGDGVMFVGSKGAFVLGTISVSFPLSAATQGYKPLIYSPPESIRLIPDELDKSYKRPAKTLPRPYSHWADWVESFKARKPAGAPFSYGSLLTEIGLLANIAYTQKGKVLYYDGKNSKFKNNDEANKLLGRTYRDGWKFTV